MMTLPEAWARRYARWIALFALHGLPQRIYEPRYLERSIACEPGPVVRFCGYVVPEFRRYDGWRASNRNNVTGWYDNDHGESCEDGTGLITGVVGLLPGRKGKTRYIAGWEARGCDCGVVWDFSRVYVGLNDDFSHDNDAALQAARAADRLAETAAEEERDYRRGLDEDDAA